MDTIHLNTRLDQQERKLHSWRTLLLPFLGEAEAYSRLRLSEDWNSEHNRKVFNGIANPYRVSTFLGPRQFQDTEVLALTGAYTSWIGKWQLEVTKRLFIQRTTNAVEILLCTPWVTRFLG